MNDGENNRDETEPVCGPMIRIVATMRSVTDHPPSKGKNGVAHGETEPCDFAPMMKIEVQLKPVAGRLNRFSVEEYHRLIERGILTENDNVELIEGYLVNKMPRNPPHDGTIQVVSETVRPSLPSDWCVRVQSAVTLAESEPEPDVALVRGTKRTYLSRHPEASDVGVIIEVADSSLLGDRADKGRIYARANVPIYWIVNLVDRQIEVYEQPSGPTAAPAYGKTTICGVGDSVSLVFAGVTVATFAVSDLLP